MCSHNCEDGKYKRPKDYKTNGGSEGGIVTPWNCLAMSRSLYHGTSVKILTKLRRHPRQRGPTNIIFHQLFLCLKTNMMTSSWVVQWEYKLLKHTIIVLWATKYGVPKQTKMKVQNYLWKNLCHYVSMLILSHKDLCCFCPCMAAFFVPTEWTIIAYVCISF